MAGAAAIISATTAINVASNIIFFIYSSLFLVLANFSVSGLDPSANSVPTRRIFVRK
jgi:hypothetical protein